MFRFCKCIYGISRRQGIRSRNSLARSLWNNKNAFGRFLYGNDPHWRASFLLSSLPAEMRPRNKAHTGITLLPRFSHSNLSSREMHSRSFNSECALLYISLFLFRQPADARVSQIDLPRLFYCHKTQKNGDESRQLFASLSKAGFCGDSSKTRGHKLERVRIYLLARRPFLTTAKNSYCVMF
jgi:hypothetical protein